MAIAVEREVIEGLYNALKGTSRLVNGELTLEGFQEEDYENLFRELAGELLPEFQDNYEYWFNKWARSYHRKFLRDRHFANAYCPQYEKPLDMQTVREQLVVFKHFLQRRMSSRYFYK